MSIEAMKMAQEIMRNNGDVSVDEYIAADKALSQAIEQAQKQDPSELDIWKVRALQAEAVIEKFMSQPEQEPVAWYDSKSGWTDFHFFKPVRKPSAPDAEWLPLYTSPPRQPGHIRMERVDKSKSDVWWNEAARIKMPSPDLYKHGDTVLCWVNEGDYYMKSPPPPRQPWVGLTEDEQDDLVYSVYYECTRMELVIGTEAKLKQKNGYAEEKNT